MWRQVLDCIMIDFIVQNWAELTVAFMAFMKVAVNLWPTEKPQQVFGYIDLLITALISDNIKKEN